MTNWNEGILEGLKIARVLVQKEVIASDGEADQHSS